MDADERRFLDKWRWNPFDQIGSTADSLLSEVGYPNLLKAAREKDVPPVLVDFVKAATRQDLQHPAGTEADAAPFFGQLKEHKGPHADSALEVLAAKFGVYAGYTCLRDLTRIFPEDTVQKKFGRPGVDGRLLLDCTALTTAVRKYGDHERLDQAGL